VTAALERCRSGRSGRSRKPLCPYGYPGFESLPLRQVITYYSMARGDHRCLRKSLIRFAPSHHCRGSCPGDFADALMRGSL
jgi:hypothetical protein